MIVSPISTGRWRKKGCRTVDRLYRLVDGHLHLENNRAYTNEHEEVLSNKIYGPADQGRSEGLCIQRFALLQTASETYSGRSVAAVSKQLPFERLLLYDKTTRCDDKWRTTPLVQGVTSEQS